MDSFWKWMLIAALCIVGGVIGMAVALVYWILDGIAEETAQDHVNWGKRRERPPVDHNDIYGT